MIFEKANKLIEIENITQTYKKLYNVEIDFENALNNFWIGDRLEGIINLVGYCKNKLKEKSKKEIIKSIKEIENLKDIDSVVLDILLHKVNEQHDYINFLIHATYIRLKAIVYVHGYQKDKEDVLNIVKDKLTLLLNKKTGNFIRDIYTDFNNLNN